MLLTTNGLGDAAVAYADRRDAAEFDALAERAVKAASGTVEPQVRIRLGYASNAIDLGSA